MVEDHLILTNLNSSLFQKKQIKVSNKLDNSFQKEFRKII